MTHEQAINAVHRAHRADLRTCFERSAEQADAVMPERVEVEVRLTASGKPASVRLVDAGNVDPVVRGCLKQVITGLDYGTFERGSTYYQKIQVDPDTYSLRFSKPVDAYHRWGLTRQEIQSVLLQNAAKLDACYALVADKPTARVVITLTLHAAGPPTRVGLKSSTLHNPDADRCLVEAVLGMKFPAPRGNGTSIVDVPLYFNAQKAWIHPVF